MLTENSCASQYESPHIHGCSSACVCCLAMPGPLMSHFLGTCTCTLTNALSPVVPSWGFPVLRSPAQLTFRHPFCTPCHDCCLLLPLPTHPSLGDDGRAGGAMLQQLPVPAHLVGSSYQELVQYWLSHPDPQHRHVSLGLLRRKAENRAWRLPYVATHPAPDTLLAPTDLVYVIRPQ